MDIRIKISACHESTELELVCTEEQYAFLKEVAKATEVVSTYDCMPFIYLHNYSEKEEEADEDNQPGRGGKRRRERVLLLRTRHHQTLIFRGRFLDSTGIQG